MVDNGQNVCIIKVQDGNEITEMEVNAKNFR